MNRKPDTGRNLKTLLVSFCILFLAAAVAVSAVFYSLFKRLNAEDRMIHAVRFIGLAQSDEFYEEIYHRSDGYIQSSELKSGFPLPDAADGSSIPGSFNGHVGRAEHYRPYAGRVYVKKEGEWLCVAVITAPKWTFLHPGQGYYAERFHMFEYENPEPGKTVSTGRMEKWKINTADMLENGIPFHPLHASNQP
jgi:hypothetical protein